jgi:hypothetical protein
MGSMGAFLEKFDPATRLVAAAAQPDSEVVIYKLYGGRVELLYNDGEHSYFVRFVESNDDPLKVVSATGITGTLDKPALLPWGIKLAAEEIINFFEKNSFINTVDNQRYTAPIPFNVFLEAVTEAKREYKRVSQEALDIGHIAHDWLEALQKEAIESKRSIANMWANGSGCAFNLPVVEPDLEGVDQTLQTLRKEVAAIQTAAVQNCVREAVDWMIKHNFRPIRVENKVYSIMYNYAGTFDTVGLFDSCEHGECCTILNPDGTIYRLQHQNLKILADWKSSKGMWKEYRYQTAAYWQAWLEEFGEELGGRVVVKMPKTVGDKFAAYFLPNDQQEKDMKAFVGLLAPYKRGEEIDLVEWQAEQQRRDKEREARLMRKAEEELQKMTIRQLRDAERAKKKADDAEAEVKAAEEKAARLAEACSWSGRYAGKNKPKCNDGKGCTSCNTKYAEAHGMTYDPVARLFDHPAATEVVQ